MAAKYRVLVVEDDEHIASMLERCISRNRALTLAGTAKAAQAIEMAFRLSPDLVLLDFTLSTPRDGFSVWDALHKLSNAPEVIAVTAAGDVSTVEKARNWGARGYVVKPFTSETIKGKLDEYVRRRGYTTGRIKRPSQLDINIMVRDGAPPRWSGRGGSPWPPSRPPRFRHHRVAIGAGAVVGRGCREPRQCPPHDRAPLPAVPG